jgi:hypothetical protein
VGGISRRGPSVFIFDESVGDDEALLDGSKNFARLD